MIDQKEVEFRVANLLAALGQDTTVDGLKDTPRRVAKMWIEFLEYEPGNMTAFDSITTDQMIIVRDIEAWSICEHHLLPFSVQASVGYISTGEVLLGVSKLARIVHQHAHKLQMQERMADDIANHLSKLVKSDDVAVYLTGQHTCMQMRGIKANHADMVTSVMRGKFLTVDAARAEFFAALK